MFLPNELTHCVKKKVVCQTIKHNYNIILTVMKNVTNLQDL